jgi:hypothetical protein
METTVKVSAQQALHLIRESNGAFFAVEFVRVQPKCPRCETAHDTASTAVASGLCDTAYCHTCNRKVGKRENGVCKVCGAAAVACGGGLEFTRKMTGRLGVQNPGEGITAPGTGAPDAMGGFEGRLQRVEPLVTVYDVGVEGVRADGQKGAYRAFRLNNLISLATAGTRYEVVPQ